jgi:acetoin utilization protein AcuC
VLVTQHGADTHFEDPLAHLAVSLDAQRAVAETIHELAHAHAEGRWVALGGGGYEIVEVVPRTWTHLVAIAAGAPVPPEAETPEEWRAEVYRRTRRVAPLRMTDGRDARWRGFDDPAGGVPAARAAGVARSAWLRPGGVPVRGTLRGSGPHDPPEAEASPPC